MHGLSYLNSDKNPYFKGAIMQYWRSREPKEGKGRGGVFEAPKRQFFGRKVHFKHSIGPEHPSKVSIGFNTIKY